MTTISEQRTVTDGVVVEQASDCCVCVWVGVCVLEEERKRKKYWNSSGHIIMKVV